MATYSFKSEPRVVAQKSAKFKEEPRPVNLMSDTRVYRGSTYSVQNIKAATPQEREKIEMDRRRAEKQREMITAQLENFKKSKVKQTPYDIRPAAPPKIEVDLTYFLTDQRDSKPDEASVPCQTDVFVPKPPTPPYQPKKTGIDIETQIWDGDLFEFDWEVQPILNVIVFKTLEQSALEVEEESELEAMALYKEQNKERKVQENEDWEKEVLAEVERIKHKDDRVRQARELYSKREHLVQKLQILNLAKTYLSKLVPNTITSLNEANIIPTLFPHQLHYEYISKVVTGTTQKAQQQIKRLNIFDEFIKSAQDRLLGSRQNLIAQYKKKAANYQTKTVNMGKSHRYIRFLYYNNRYSPPSEFTQRLDSALTGEEYTPNDFDRQLLEDIRPSTPKEGTNKSRSLVEEERSFEQVEIQLPKYKAFLIDNFNKLSFAVANNPYFDTVKDRRKYGFHIEAYDATGRLLDIIDVNSTPQLKGFKVLTNCRDMVQKVSDDEKVIINLKQIPEEVHHILLFLKTQRQGEDFPFARYRLSDYQTSQDIDVVKVKAEDFQENDDDGPILPLYLGYRIYRQEYNPRGLVVQIDSLEGAPNVIMPQQQENWLLEFFNIPIQKRLEDASKIFQQVLADGDAYLREFTDELVKYRERKVREELEYRIKIDELEQKAKKKRKKKQGRAEKRPMEPARMAEYRPLEQGYPSKCFGPVMLQNVKELGLENIYAKVQDVLDPKLLSTFEEPFMVKIRHRELTQPDYLFKARTVAEVRIEERPKPVVVEEPEEAEEDEQQFQEYLIQIQVLLLK